MFAQLVQNGIRLTVEAETFLKSEQDMQKLSELCKKIIDSKKPFIDKKDIDELISPTIFNNLINENKNLNGESIVYEVKGVTDFLPLSKEYSSNLKVNHTKDVTGKSRTKGDVDNFISHFRNRYERLARLLKRNGTSSVDLDQMKKYVGQTVRLTVLVSQKRQTKKGNLMFEVEDLTGAFKIIIPAGKEKINLLAGAVLSDDVVAFTGRVMEAFVIAEDIEWPDLPVIREKKRAEVDVAVAYLSDLHFGSRFFLEKKLDAFADFLLGKNGARELASKIKYVEIAGDIVDGIGVYPNQEKELTVKDIYSQYELFDRFLEKIPDYIDVIVAPGNHDAVRRGEPQPALGTDLVKSSKIVRIGNPSWVTIEGFHHLVYHGTSMDSMIASIPGSSYMYPEKVMVEFLKRRHLSPIYGGNLIIPENIDYLVIDEAPDIFHSGHVHKNGYMQYRGTLIINSGTFQDRTDFQVKQGHIPTPALVPVYELKNNKLRTLDFNL